MRSVSATFRYLRPIHELVPPVPPFRYAYTPPQGEPESNEALEGHEMTVKDIRGREEEIGLDSSGFGLLHNIPVENRIWDSSEWIRDFYYQEIEELLKQWLGASKIIIFDHTLRRRSKDTEHRPDKPGKRQPVYRAHIDQTPAAGAARVYRHLPTAEADRLSKNRVQLINVWRPLRGPVRDAPLGLCDARSIGATDLVVTRLIYPDREGSTYGVHFNLRHEWNYLSDMQPDEAILIKCYDNKYPDRIAVHTGFSVQDDTGAPPRQSIEVRCLSVPIHAIHSKHCIRTTSS